MNNLNLAQQVIEDNTDFLVGDVVVFRHPVWSGDINAETENYVYPMRLFTVIVVAKYHVAFKEVCGFFNIDDLRHASTLELKLKRRLTLAEQALAEAP